MHTMKNLAIFLILSFGFAACGGDDIQVYKIAKGGAGPVAKAPAPMPMMPPGGSGELPADHPPIGGDTGGLPEDHPPIGEDAGGGMGGMQAPPPSSAPAPKDGVSGMGWTMPKGWTGEGASGMRKATFRYAGTVTSVIALGGAAGGDLANANRWRGQIGLGQMTEAEFQKASSFVQSGVGKVRVVEYKGAEKSVLGGMVLVDGQTWFFKGVGTADAIAKAKPGFLSLLKSLKPKA
jgi:hypothetical protein